MKPKDTATPRSSPLWADAAALAFLAAFAWAITLI